MEVTIKLQNHKSVRYKDIRSKIYITYVNCKETKSQETNLKTCLEPPKPLETGRRKFEGALERSFHRSGSLIARPLITLPSNF